MKYIVLGVSIVAVSGMVLAQDGSIFEAAQRAVDAANRAESIVPSGAVMAFNLSTCPAGWAGLEAAKGRVIVGVGEGNRDELDRKLTMRKLGQIGGVETHKLTENELPSHTHSFTGTAVSRGGNGGTGRELSVGDGFDYGVYSPSGNISNTGGSAEHQNMPPFIGLLICHRL